MDRGQIFGITLLCALAAFCIVCYIVWLVRSSHGHTKCLEACPKAKVVYNFVVDAERLGTSNGKVTCRCITGSIVEINE